MTAINFPAGAASGATHTEAGITWTFDGTAWNTTGVGYVAKTGEAGVVNLSGANLVLPGGTTATRPASPVGGEFRYNTDQGGFTEFFDGTHWVGSPADVVTLDGGGWGGTDPTNPGRIPQQFVGSSVWCTFNVRPIVLTPGVWLVAANIWVGQDPNRASSFDVQAKIPLEKKGNIIYSSKSDGPTFRASGIEYNVEACLTCVAVVRGGNYTLDKIECLSTWSSGGNHDLKGNCWYTALKLN